MLGNARAYRLHPVAAKSTPDAWLQLIKTIKRQNLKHKPNYIHTNMYNYNSRSKYTKKIQKYKMFILITNYKHQSMVIKNSNK